MILRMFGTFGMSWLFAAADTMGCAGGHATTRGSVVMRIDPATAQVALGNAEVTVHDRVRLYRNVCEPSGRLAVCQKAAIADGTVTDVLDEHNSIVTFPEGMTIEKGDIVERLYETNRGS